MALDREVKARRVHQFEHVRRTTTLTGTLGEAVDLDRLAEVIQAQCTDTGLVQRLAVELDLVGKQFGNGADHGIGGTAGNRLDLGSRVGAGSRGGSRVGGGVGVGLIALALLGSGIHGGIRLAVGLLVAAHGETPQFGVDENCDGFSCVPQCGYNRAVSLLCQP